jgi:hypothetical protein
MNRSNHPKMGVANQYGLAVSSRDPQKNAGPVCNKGIGVLAHKPYPVCIFRGIQANRPPAVNLVDKGKNPVSQSIQRQVQVGFHSNRIITS